MKKKITTIGQLKTALGQVIAQVAQAAAQDIAALDSSKQDKFTGMKGQVMGFDSAGRPVAQSADSLKGLFYGACATAAATAEKTVVLDGFFLAEGAVAVVKFTNANTAANPTLNVNSTGAKSIKKYGTTSAGAYMWAAGAVVEFVYDGTNWVMVQGTLATTTYYGLAKLSSSVSSTSTTLAATSSAVKQAYDLADSKQSKPLEGSVTIPATGWNSDSTEIYPRYYDIAVTGVTASDRASVDIAAASMSTALACGLCPACETLAGKIRLRAVNVPAASLTATYWIEKGA